MKYRLQRKKEDEIRITMIKWDEIQTTTIKGGEIQTITIKRRWDIDYDKKIDYL